MNWNLVEAPMEDSVLSFLKAEWKVRDTGSAHWASSKLYKGPSIDAAYQVLIHLAKRFLVRREDCLEINQSETKIVCGGHAMVGPL
jgi:hypothetical protein